MTAVLGCFITKKGEQKYRWTRHQNYIRVGGFSEEKQTNRSSHVIITIHNRIPNAEFTLTPARRCRQPLRIRLTRRRKNPWWSRMRYLMRRALPTIQAESLRNRTWKIETEPRQNSRRDIVDSGSREAGWSSRSDETRKKRAHPYTYGGISTHYVYSRTTTPK